MRNGKKISLFGTQLTNLRGKPEPREQTVSIKFPSEKAWRNFSLGKLKPDELTISLGVVSATWKFKKD